jgi:hypothetical protein
MSDCTHEDGEILYGKTVYNSSLGSSDIRVVQVYCSCCGTFGTQVEQWVDNDYTPIHETWHELKDYIKGEK